MYSKFPMQPIQMINTDNTGKIDKLIDTVNELKISKIISKHFNSKKETYWRR